MVACCVLAAGCGHVIHPAAVQPGPSVDVVVSQDWSCHAPKPVKRGGGEQTAYLGPPGAFEPFTSSRPALQIALGYGWRHSENVATQLQLVGGNLTPPTLDGYFQMLGHPIDAGVGVLLPFIGYFGAYGMVGKGLPLGLRHEVRLDGAVRAIYDYSEDTRSWGPTAMMSLRRGGIAFGLWGDALFFDGVTFATYCDETCRPEDFTRRRFAMGAYLRFGRALAPAAP
jgi:hypothetical protein